MRPVVLVLLMLLLPLRAWAGDVMALSMLQERPVPAAMMVMPGDHDQHDHHDVNAEHAELAGHDAPAPQTGDDCPSHVACDVCNGPVLSLPLWTAEGTVVRHHPPVPLATVFASLVPHRHHKPPIA